MKPHIVFFGSSKYSAIGEKIIHNKLGISFVVTLPDRQLGRKKVLTPNPVAQFAKDNTIPYVATEKITNEIILVVNEQNPDFLIVEDFGLILPQKLLELPKYAPINIHHSLLPKYRGVAPAPFAILAGEKTSGVTVMEMTKKFDKGPILAQKEINLAPNETTESLLTKLNEIGASLAVEAIDNYLDGIIHKTPQDESKATYTKFMSTQDGYIDIKNPPSPDIIDRMIRAYFPWPGVWTNIELNGKQVRMKLFPDKKLQIEGKKVMSYKDFINGYKEGKDTLQKLKLLD